MVNPVNPFKYFQKETFQLGQLFVANWILVEESILLSPVRNTRQYDFPYPKNPGPQMEMLWKGLGPNPLAVATVILAMSVAPFGSRLVVSIEFLFLKLHHIV